MRLTHLKMVMLGLIPLPHLWIGMVGHSLTKRVNNVDMGRTDTTTTRVSSAKRLFPSRLGHHNRDIPTKAMVNFHRGMVLLLLLEIQIRSTAVGLCMMLMSNGAPSVV